MLTLLHAIQQKCSASYITALPMTASYITVSASSNIKLTQKMALPMTASYITVSASSNIKLTQKMALPMTRIERRHFSQRVSSVYRTIMNPLHFLST